MGTKSKFSKSKAMTIAIAGTAPLVAAMLVTSPAAQARPSCDSAGDMTVCQTEGSVSIQVRPGTTAPPAGPLWPWLGSGLR